MARATKASPIDFDPVPLAAESMAGDLRDFVLDRLRHDISAIPWHLKPEGEQRAVIERVEGLVRDVVIRACEVIASRGQPSACGTVVRIGVRDGLQVVVNVAASDPQRHALIDAIGSRVMITRTEADSFLGERGKVRIIRHQPDLLDEDEAETF